MERSPTDILSRVNITDTNSYEFYTPDGPELAVTSVLTIDPTRGIDAGAYRCVASNEIGASMTPAENERNTELYVQGMVAIFYQYVRIMNLLFQFHQLLLLLWER